MNVSRTVVRTITKSAPKNREVHEVYKTIQDKYRHFQMDNNLLIHQRGGTMDYVLFGTTILVNGIGFALAGENFYKMAFNK